MPDKSSAGPSSKPSSPIRQIQSLESTLLADLSDPNPLLPILVYARHDSPEVVHKAIWALHRCFVPLVSANKVGALISTDTHSKRDGEEEGEGGSTERQVKSWVRGRLVEYVEILGGLLRDKEPALRVSHTHIRVILRWKVCAELTSRHRHSHSSSPFFLHYPPKAPQASTPYTSGSSSTL